MSRKSVQCIAAVAVIGLAWLAPTAVEAQTGPDLGISGLVAVSGLYGITPPGWPLSLSATVRNDGDAASAATTLRYYLSTDATITTSDTSVGTDAVGALAAGATSSPPRLDFNAPSAPGTYYYGACVDAVTGESDTTNNCSTSVQVTVSEAATGPDLDPYAIVVTTNPGGTRPGGNVGPSVGVRNDGDESSAATTVRFYQSTDATITTADTEVGTNALGALSPGATASIGATVSAPATPGTYYYGACVDAVAGESDTTNNCSGSVPVVVSGSPVQTSPDLTVGSPSVNDNSPTTEGAFTLSATVRNDGDGAAAATTLRYYRSTDAAITSADTSVGTDAVGGLSAGATSPESISLTAPSAAGTYYYGACVDEVTDESDATNNCSSAVSVTVSPPPPPPPTGPDLGISGLVAVSGLYGITPPGWPLSLSATVRNDGDAASAATTLRYYRSTDATITTSDTSVGTDAVGALAAGATSSPPRLDFNAPSAPGTYYYGACVDAVTGESDTTNNCSSAVSVTVSPPPPPPPTGPDLTVHGIITVTSLDGTPPGGSFQLGASVRNDGDESSAATTLRYYHSTDATITTSDTEVGTDTVGGLSAGATTRIVTYVTAPASAGTYYYGLCVDAVTGESDTTNNCSGSASVVVSGSPVQTSPDLTVGSPSVNDNSPTTEGAFTLSATVRNDGDGAAAATTLRYYRSTDAAITSADTSVGTDAVGGLSAGATSPESISLTAPSAAGTYYYGACVDEVTDESDATNNCSTSVQIVVLATAQQEVEPKPPGEVQAVVDEAVARAGGLRAGGAPVTIELSTLFSFGAGGSAGTTYTARSSDPELVTAEITDGQLVLTPGNPPPAGAFSSLAVGAAAGDPVRVMITVTAERGGEMAEVESTVDVLESATGGGPRQTVPDAPTNLLADGRDGEVGLTWDAPENGGGAAITDYEYRIDQTGEWISIGSTDTTHTVTGLVNGTAYVFQVRAVTAAGSSAPSNRAEATPIAPMTLLVANFSNGNSGAFNSRVYLWNPSESSGDVTVRVFTLPLTGGLAQELTTAPLNLGTLGAKSALNVKVAEDILAPLGITLPYTNNEGDLTLEFTIEVADVRGATQVFSSSLAFGTHPLQEIPSTSSGSPTVLVANFMNGNSDAFNSRAHLFNPSDSDGNVTVRVFTLPLSDGTAQELTGPPLDLGTLEARSALNIKLAEDILTPLGITTPYTTDGGNLTLEFTVQAAAVRGAAQVFSSSFAFGVYPLQEIPSTSSGSPTVLVANFMNGNSDAFSSRAYLFNPSDSDGNVTVRVFTLPLSDGTARELTGPPLDLGTLEARSALNLKLVEDILDPLGITLPYTTDGGNLTLEFTIQAADVRGTAQVFSSSFAFGTYPLQQLPLVSVGTPTGLVANFMNGNNAAFHSRVYLWNPSESSGDVTVRVFTLPLTGGLAQELTTAPLNLGTLGAKSALNVKLVENILAPLGITLPYTTDGGNLTLEFTIQAADVRGAAQVFSSSFAFGTVPLQVIQ